MEGPERRGECKPQISLISRKGMIERMKKVVVKKNRYVDSVTLMSIGRKTMNLSGIENAEALMGTPANNDIFMELGYILPPDTSSDDLVLAVTAENEKQIDKAFLYMDDILNHRASEENKDHYHSIDDIDLQEDVYDIVQISVPGEYAYEEAKKALDSGLNVFIFSDNVSIEEEKTLKMLGEKKNLLVMGPDCGVAFLNGVCLGAGSIMKKGNVGIVAASGSGAQEIACILDGCGVGVSEIIGTGGRDLYPQIGGIAMKKGMKLLENDTNTEVIILVSKLADSSVMEDVLCYADGLTKPIVAIFMGASNELFSGHRVSAANSLVSAAIKTCEILGVDAGSLKYSDDQIKEIVSTEIKLYTKGQKYVRGIYCGGTFTEEALIYFSENANVEKMYSNLSTSYVKKLADHHVSEEHTILDLGSEDFTAEAPHPVFDPMLRIKRLKKEVQDSEVAVILLDFITGPGVAEDPFTDVIQLIEQTNDNSDRHITFIANICGSHLDPQNIALQKKLLKQAGVIVTSCSYESARLAGAFMNALEDRNN